MVKWSLKWRAHYGGFAPALRREASSSKGWVPLGRDTDRYLLMPATINDHAVVASLDTGAPRSVVRYELAEQLRTSLAARTSARAFTADVTAPLRRLSALTLGEMSLGAFDVATHDVSAIEPALTKEVPLLLGQDVLQKGVLDLQFTRRRGRFVTAFTPDEGTAYESLDLSHASSGVPEIMVRPEDQIEERAVINLGSPVVCSISADYAKRVGILSNRPQSTTVIAGAGGVNIGAIFTLQSLKIGSYQLRHVPVCINDNWRADAPIILGWPLFKNFDIALAYNHEVFLRANVERLGSPLPRDRSGIWALRLSDHLHIRHVASGSPAELAGLSVNDRIVAIGGRLVDSSYPPAGSRQGHRPSGTRLDLVLADGRHVALVLSEYF